MSTNSPSQELYDLLITKNFDPEAKDARTGQDPKNEEGQTDIAKADMFVFDYKGESGQNYGTVVILMPDNNTVTVSFGDNVGRSMDSEDKQGWYNFLEQLRMFAKRNLLKYDVQDISRLKYTIQGIAAIKEGLFEGYYGNRKFSYSGEPTEARLVIKHSRPLGESDARFRHVESLFIETADSERFRLPFKNLAGGRAMLEHVRQGGRPYDPRGQHIREIVEQISVLGQFRRAHRGRVFEGAAAELVTETDHYYESLRKNLKSLQHSRGYSSYFESWNPVEITETELVVEDIKNLFVEQTVDPRILQALPVLAQVQKGNQMKEADIFEAWANHITEGTWSRPDTPEKIQLLKDFMSAPQPVGPDAINATAQLGDILGNDSLFDMLMSDAEADPESDARETVQYWINTVADRDPEIAQLRAELEQPADNTGSEVPISQEPDAAVVDADTDQYNEDQEFARLKQLLTQVR
jgi:hypothetical protein